MLEASCHAVLAAYPDDCRPQVLEDLGGGGGFSGARLWRVHARRGMLCLRRWPPEHPGTERLEFIQAVLWHVTQEGFRLVPLPYETRKHKGYVVHGEHLWELSPWMEGRADYREKPNRARIEAALQALAKFHIAAASFPLPQANPALIPAVRLRMEAIAYWTPARLEQVRQAVADYHGPYPKSCCQEILRIYRASAETLRTQLAPLVDMRLNLQPCIRDIWDEHVFFDGDEVSGIVDFGSMNVDQVATDVARLLGSLAANDADAWEAGLRAYSCWRTLSSDERRLAKALHQVSSVLAGMSWLKWLFVEGRQFENPAAVSARIELIHSRMAVFGRPGIGQ